MTVKLIAAHDKNMGIGFDNGLLWGMKTQQDDMKRFKDLTIGHPVIMGRKTWESIPFKYRPLPGRLCIVLSRNEEYCAEQNGSIHAAAYYMSSLEAALTFCKNLSETEKFEGMPLGDRIARQAYDFSSVWICGGGSIYEEAMKKGLVDELFLTKIRTEFNDVDTRLYQNNDFLVKSMERFPADDRNAHAYEFCRMVKDKALIGDL